MPEGTTRLTLIRHLLIVPLAFSSILLHPAAQAALDPGAVATGAWGGEHIVLEVSEEGAEAEFDCARGQVTQPLMLDKHGDFNVGATFTPEHAGPVRRDESVGDVPAHYSGHVEGHTMNLTVTLGRQKLGSFALTRGLLPNLRKCR